MSEERKELPKKRFFIFEKIEGDFEEHMNQNFNENNYKNFEEFKDKKWNRLVEWIERYQELLYSIVPDEYTRCLVETKQEYKEFSINDIENVIEKLGKISQHMYSAERDIFHCNHISNKDNFFPLGKYYISCLEQITWIVATFYQRTKYDNFTDLLEILEED